MTDQNPITHVVIWQRSDRSRPELVAGFPSLAEAQAFAARPEVEAWRVIHPLLSPEEALAAIGEAQAMTAGRDQNRAEAVQGADADARELARMVQHFLLSSRARFVETDAELERATTLVQRILAESPHPAVGTVPA